MLHPNEMKQRASIRIVRGDGCYVFDEQGASSSTASRAWNVNVGHNRQEVKDAIVRQLDGEYFQLFDGISHPRAEELSKKVIDMLEPEGCAACCTARAAPTRSRPR